MEVSIHLLSYIQVLLALRLSLSSISSQKGSACVFLGPMTVIPHAGLLSKLRRFLVACDVVQTILREHPVRYIASSRAVSPNLWETPSVVASLSCASVRTIDSALAVARGMWSANNEMWSVSNEVWSVSNELGSVTCVPISHGLSTDDWLCVSCGP